MTDGKWEYLVEDPETSLEIVSEINRFSEENPKTDVLWPEGEIFKIQSYISPQNFRLKIGKSRDWFAMDGEVTVSKHEVLTMRELLELLDSERDKGRFLQNKDGNFIALTEHLRKQLKELKTYSQYGEDGYRFSPLVALLVEEFTELLEELEADKSWKSQVKKLGEMRSLKPTLPTTFQGEFREYQLEGFEWMSRLAHWGVGACFVS